MIRTLIIILFCLPISFTGFAQKPSETIPSFIFYNLNKVQFTNKNLPVGKEILFIFFDVTCDHCQHTIETLSQKIHKFDGIAIYLITLDNKILINNFFNKFGKNLIAKKNVVILQDLKNQFIKQFGPRKYPSVFLYSSKRRLLLYSDEDQYLEKILKIVVHS